MMQHLTATWGFHECGPIEFLKYYHPSCKYFRGNELGLGNPYLVHECIDFLSEARGATYDLV